MALHHTVSVCPLPWTQMHNMHRLQNSAICNVLGLNRAQSLFGKNEDIIGFCTAHTCNIHTIHTFKERNIHTQCTHIQRQPHSSPYTHAQSSVKAQPSILTFCSVRATVTIHLSSRCQLSDRSCQLSG